MLTPKKRIHSFKVTMDLGAPVSAQRALEACKTLLKPGEVLLVAHPTGTGQPDLHFGKVKSIGYMRKEMGVVKKVRENSRRK